MGRAAGRAGREARGARLLTAWRGAALPGLALLTGCASVQEPPGGPPDFSPPALLAIRPDSGAVLPEYREPVRFEFDEVISEQQGRLHQFVLVSPRPEVVDVRWKRDAIEVRPDGGWRRDVVYHVHLLPGILDLRNNRMTEDTRVVFTTGGPVPDTRLAGTVIDWQAGRAAARALVEAVLMPDSLVYVTRADSTGAFALSAVPVGTYHVIATVDENTNLRRDGREAFDSLLVRLDSTTSDVFWAFVHDTTGPGLRTATRVDSITVRLAFDQRLRPGDPDSGAVNVWALPDTVAVPVRQVWRPAVWDSVRAAEAAEAAAAADTAAAEAADTLAADTAAPAAPPAPAALPDTAQQDTSRIAQLLRQRPPLIDEWVIRLGLALTPGSRYLVEATATNPNGATGSSRTVLIIPEAPPDTTAADTAAADTTGVRPRPR